MASDRERAVDLIAKTVVISGASRGIGAAAARCFAAAGANLVLLARSGDAIDRLAGEIGDAALAIRCDVSRFADIQAAMERTLAVFGGLDVLVCNAGVIAPISPLAGSDPESWGKAIDINLKGVYHAMRAALPVMLDQGGGSILTVSSGAAHHPIEGWSQYCAAKAGAAMLTACVHEEAGARGIRAIGLSPGTVATQMQAEIRDSGINPVSRLDWSDHIPPEWPAQALVWMCTKQAAAFIGQEISLRDPAILARVGLAV